MFRDEGTLTELERAEITVYDLPLDRDRRADSKIEAAIVRNSQTSYLLQDRSRRSSTIVCSPPRVSNEIYQAQSPRMSSVIQRYHAIEDS